MSKVFKIDFDYNHSGDSGRDAFHVPFAEEQNISVYMIDTEMYESSLLPEKIYFQANFNLIPEYDYPLTDLNIPVMSKKMLGITQTIGDFNFEIVPITMIDDTYLDKRFDSNNNLLASVPKNEDYVAVRLTDGLYSFLDMDKSEYRPSRVNPNIPSRVRKIVLKEPENGFPPLFRVKYTPSTLFVSKETKEALEATNIKGCVFEPVETS